MRRKRPEKTKKHNASRLRVGVVVSKYNSDITGELLKGALNTLRDYHVPERNITVVEVPGSFEIPYGCLALIKKKKPHAIIALGCVLKGETKHDEYIASAVSHGIMDLSLDHNIPISFGVLTPNTLAQARTRSRGKYNKGVEAALAALESALLSDP